MLYQQGRRADLCTLIAPSFESSAPSLHVPEASENERAAVLALFDRLVRLPTFAHHPACRYWSNHLLYVGRHPLCLGCTCMFAGIVAGVALILSGVYEALTPSQAFMLGFMAYVPTLVQVRYQRYWFKVVYRFSLGNGIVLAVWAALFGAPWLSWGAVVNVLYLLTVATLYVGTVRWRAKHLDVPCRRCPEGRFPFCSWRQPELRAAVRDHQADLVTLPKPLVQFLQVVDSTFSMLQSGEGAWRVTFLGWCCDSSPAMGEPPHRPLASAETATGPVPTTRSSDVP